MDAVDAFSSFRSLSSCDHVFYTTTVEGSDYHFFETPEYSVPREGCFCALFLQVSFLHCDSLILLTDVRFP